MVLGSRNGNANGSPPRPSNNAEPSRSADAVLGEVLVNQSALRIATTAGHNVEEDMALAKLLQEQERALLMLAGPSALGSARLENVPPGEGAGPSGDGGEGDALTDEQLAWQLMQEEEQAFQQRLFALAGAAPGDAEGGAVDQEDDSGAESEGADPDTMSYEQLTALGEVVGTVATGVKTEHIDALPVRRFACCQAEGGAEEGEEQCAICRVEYEADDEATVLPCGHFYHPPCIATWLAQKKVCPQCGKEVVGPAAAEAQEGKAQAAALESV